MDDVPFKEATIALVGVGLIGGSLGLAFKRLGIGREVIGISRKETLDEAQALGVVDAGYVYEDMARGWQKPIWCFCVRPFRVFWLSCPM